MIFVDARNRISGIHRSGMGGNFGEGAGRNLHGAVRRLKKERAKVNCRVALAKLDTVASGQTMEEKAQHDKG